MPRHKRRQGAPRERLQRAFERFGGLCYYCRRTTTLKYPEKPSAASVDHVVPKSRGGGDARGNLVLACRDCNNARGDLDFETFRRLARRARAAIGRTGLISEAIRAGRLEAAGDDD